MRKDRKLNNVIEALAEHEDPSAVKVLEEVGTNCADDEVRTLTAKALIKRNSVESLSVVIVNKGKGVNDLSANVAMSSINELLALKDKTKAMEILSKTEESHEDSSVRETARSLKALMAFS